MLMGGDGASKVDKGSGFVWRTWPLGLVPEGRRAGLTCDAPPALEDKPATCGEKTGYTLRRLEEMN